MSDSLKNVIGRWDEEDFTTDYDPACDLPNLLWDERSDRRARRWWWRAKLLEIGGELVAMILPLALLLFVGYLLS